LTKTFLSGARSRKRCRIDEVPTTSKDHRYNKSPFASQDNSTSTPKVAVSDHENTACDNKNPVAAGHENIVDGDKTAGDQDPVAESSQNTASFENIACDPDPVAENHPNTEYDYVTPGNGQLFAEECVNTDIDETLDHYRAKIEKQKEEIDALKRKVARMEPTKKLFNEDQFYKLLHPKTTSKWSLLTVEQCLQMYLRIGTSGYEFLLSKGYPLVSISVLQRYLRKLNSDPGIQYDAIKVMAKKVELMPRKARYCALVVDEFEIQAKKEYDCSSGTMMGIPTIPPSDRALELRAKKANFNPENLMAQKCFNGCVGGLLDRWSQLVYYGFTERSFNKRVIATHMKELIGILQSINLDVCSFAGDMGMLGV
jgi:hypothetical protein